MNTSWFVVSTQSSNLYSNQMHANGGKLLLSNLMRRDGMITLNEADPFSCCMVWKYCVAIVDIGKIRAKGKSSANKRSRT